MLDNETFWRCGIAASAIMFVVAAIDGSWWIAGAMVLTTVSAVANLTRIRRERTGSER